MRAVSGAIGSGKRSQSLTVPDQKGPETLCGGEGLRSVPRWDVSIGLLIRRSQVQFSAGSPTFLQELTGPKPGPGSPNKSDLATFSQQSILKHSEKQKKGNLFNVVTLGRTKKFSDTPPSTPPQVHLLGPDVRFRSK